MVPAELMQERFKGHSLEDAINRLSRRDMKRIQSPQQVTTKATLEHRNLLDKVSQL